MSIDDLHCICRPAPVVNHVPMCISWYIQLLEEILKDIATRRESASSLEPGKFVLKPEVFAAEYDSTFFHLPLQVLQ